MFYLDEFINNHVIKRKQPLCKADIEVHKSALEHSIAGKNILVIGGAGSIGSSFIKSILSFRPGGLCVVDTNENALAELTRDIRSSGSYVPHIYLPYPMDYSSAVFQRMFRQSKRGNGTSGFDIVANFSAHKHVRSEKDIYSIEALIRNNIIYAKGLLDLLSECVPEIYFCVSTDKAANPVNIMGASKRIMEDLIFSYSDRFPVKTARFANVAFSSGSLPDGMLKRIALCQPISAPSDVKRYFVSPQEAGQICMLAAVLGENRSIFFPKLEEENMATFDQIARKLLSAYGYQAYLCGSDEEAIAMAKTVKEQRGKSRVYPVYFSVSDTSGEKAFEEFYTRNETVDMDRFQSLGVIIGKKAPDRTALEDLIKVLDEAFDRRYCKKEDIVKILSTYLPEFVHSEMGKSLDAKM